MGFRSLRVLNEDVIAAGQGFGRHPHRDMEILTYIISGELAHQDSLDNTRTIGPGTIQRMSAGTGIRHAEFNPSPTESTHLVQIWLMPDRVGHTPSYEELDFGPEGARNQLRLLASPGPDDGATTWHQDARLHASQLDRGRSLDYELAPGRHAWLQVIGGEIALNETTLTTGDGAAVSDESKLRLQASQDSEILWFDLA